MNPNFNLSFNKMLDRESISENSDDRPTGAFDASYPETGHVRNLCFVSKNGNRLFLNYNYLVSGEFIEEDNAINLVYSSHQINMIGVNLSTLYYDIMQQITKQIVCTDSRYNLVGEDEKPIVNQIEIKILSG